MDTENGTCRSLDLMTVEPKFREQGVLQWTTRIKIMRPDQLRLGDFTWTGKLRKLSENILLMQFFSLVPDDFKVAVVDEQTVLVS